MGESLWQQDADEQPGLSTCKTPVTFVIQSQNAVKPSFARKLSLKTFTDFYACLFFKKKKRKKKEVERNIIQCYNLSTLHWYFHWS